MQTRRPDVMLSHRPPTYIQHKHAPGTEGASAFYRMMDGYPAQLDAAGAVGIAPTADHGMNAKVAMDGTPDVIYLQDWFDAWLGAGKTRVILPITDPVCRAITVRSAPLLPSICLGWRLIRLEAATKSRQARGIERFLGRAGCRRERSELPPDRIGDLVVAPSVSP